MHPTVPLVPYKPAQSETSAARAFYDIVKQRRSIREFSSKPVSEETIHACVAAAGTAPSGANKQPWRFVCVRDAAVKRNIREDAEAQEREFYSRRATPEWLADLAPLGTDDHKEFLEVAPWLVVVFKLMKTDPDESGRKGKVYYVDESVGIATGMFLTACHHAGLSTLTHTPSPMAFLSKILGRPEHERPFLLIPVGYAADNCRVPDIHRKPVSQIMTIV